MAAPTKADEIMGSRDGSVDGAVSPIPEVRSSNPVFGKNFTFYCQLYWKDENKEKEAGKGPFF